MKNLCKISFMFLAALAIGSPVFAQTALIQTTITAAIDSQTRTIPVASVTNIQAGYYALIDNEAVSVYAVNTAGKQITVAPRGSAGTGAFAHKSGSMVLVGSSQAFVAYDPSGTCTNGQGLFQYSPIVNTRTGNQWLCSSVTGKVVPGFGNTTDLSAPTTAVASAAALVTPSGPIFHVTGTSGITGFNIPVGFDPTSGGQICIIPDGILTTTTANNFALASTTVVSKTLCWTYDPATTKFYPSY